MHQFGRSQRGERFLNVAIGWQPTCTCYDDHHQSGRKETLPVDRCVVLDPFGGAGTTGMVADRLGRDSVLVELNPEYARMAEARIVEDAGPMFAQVEVVEFGS